jgi:hypothetical protein
VHNCSPEVHPSDKLEVIWRIGFAFDNIVNNLVEDCNWSSDPTDEKGLCSEERVDCGREELAVSPLNLEGVWTDLR